MEGSFIVSGNRVNPLLRRPAMPTKSVRLSDGSKSGVLELRLDHLRALRSRFDPRTSGALEVQRARMNLRPHTRKLETGRSARLDPATAAERPRTRCPRWWRDETFPWTSSRSPSSIASTGLRIRTMSRGDPTTQTGTGQRSNAASRIAIVALRMSRLCAAGLRRLRKAK